MDLKEFLSAIRRINVRGCVDAAVHVQELVKYAEKTYGLDRYSAPVLIGNSTGAGLVYALLAQQAAEAFSGAISLGFCPGFPAFAVKVTGVPSHTEVVEAEISRLTGYTGMTVICCWLLVEGLFVVQVKLDVS